MKHMFTIPASVLCITPSDTHTHTQEKQYNVAETALCGRSAGWLMLFGFQENGKISTSDFHSARSALFKLLLMG